MVALPLILGVIFIMLYLIRMQRQRDPVRERLQRHRSRRREFREEEPPNPDFQFDQSPTDKDRPAP